MSPEKTFQIRLAILLGLMSLWAGILVYRLAQWQIVHDEEIRKFTEHQHFKTEEIPARRGEIRDRNGHLLAMSREYYRIYADPQMVDDPAATAKALAKVLNKDRRWQRQRARSLASDKRYRIIARRVPERLAKDVVALELSGVAVDTEMYRRYPNGWTAAHLLGFANRDGSAKEGLELFYDARMGGQPGKRELLRDGFQRRNVFGESVLVWPQDGQDLELTIDSNLQFFVENSLRRSLKTNRAANVSAIVMDPRTGAILAMANMPDFNPNAFSQFSSYERKNRAIVDTYDPASAFKIVSVAAALDAGAVSLDDMFFCENGAIQVGNRNIKDYKPFGKLSVREILWYSSNVGTVKIAQKLPRDTFYQYVRAFGFGERTGVDLPAEAAGILAPVEDWTATTPAYMSIGYEITVTPLQMLRAACVVANGGFLVQPHVVAASRDKRGRQVYAHPATEAPRVIRQATADQMRRALRGVVTEGTAKAANLTEVAVFGKTGTAQRLQGGSYLADRFNPSFVGFFPVENPRYGMIVVVHDPKGGKTDGGDVAAPVFAEIARQIVAYDRARTPGNYIVVDKGTPGWSPGVDLPDRHDMMPNLKGLGLRDLLQICRRLGLDPELVGDGRVVAQLPRPGAPIPNSRVCKVILKEG